MTARIIDGKAAAAEVRARLAGEVAELSASGVVPGLAAVLVGDDPASQVYVGSKEKAAHGIGMASFVHRLPATTSQDELLARVAGLNGDPAVHGIIVQLPLPPGLDPIDAQEALDFRKDVDGLTPMSAGLLALGRPRFVPCTPLGVQYLLTREGVKVEGSHTVVVGRSNLVGRPLATLLSHKGHGSNATVTLCHTGTTDLAEHTRRADILIVAAGVPRYVTGDMIRPGAVVIDVGMHRLEDGLAGDVDFPSAAEVAGAITPVPGGVGPMTVAMLLRNTVAAARMAARPD
ncbi:MAG: bifunctional 5,10-methylenetetrahydrofolate dehydrogenase/5,10-methenyltetrahydrofolate cyclohydrolase [Actinomycetota bacterium]